jgi:hypothetical protein
MLEPNGLAKSQAGHSTTEAEKRKAVRLPCSHQSSYRELGTGKCESHLGRVVNISSAGIGVVAKRWVKPGTVFILTLRDENGRPFRPMVTRVMHTTARPDGLWLLGGAFIRKLSGAELRELLQADPSCFAEGNPDEPAG